MLCLLLLLLSGFSRVQLCATPETAAHQAPPSLGFYRQEHLSRFCHFLLQCMKVKSKSEVIQPCLTQRPHGPQPNRLLHPWDFPGNSTRVGCHCLLKEIKTKKGQLHLGYEVILVTLVRAVNE